MNLAVLARELARVIDNDFEEDLKESCSLTLGMLSERTPLGKVKDVIDHALETES